MHDWWISIVAGTTAAVIVLLQNRKTQKAAKVPATNPPKQPDVIDSTPDLPVSFGFKCIWLAIKTTDSSAVAKAIGLQRQKVANWKSGIEAAHDSQIFITPPINGWTLLVGVGLPDSSDGEGAIRMLESLSQEFGETQYFATNRVVELHAWARARDGKLCRVFCYVGERGEIVLNRGEITEEEQNLGLSFTESNMPCEEDVIAIAERWSVNPTILETHTTVSGTGIVGFLASDNNL